MFTIDPYSDRPKYKQLADQVRAKIESGEFRPGDTIPSEERLGQLTGLSRSMVREAIKILRAEGLVIVEQEGPRRTTVAKGGAIVVVRAGDSVTSATQLTITRVADGSVERHPGGTQVVSE